MNGGDWELSTRTGMRPLGSRRRNQSFFCSLVLYHDVRMSIMYRHGTSESYEMSMTDVVHSVP